MAIATFEPFDETIETQMRSVFETLSEKDQRRFAAIQARQLGHGGIGYISEVLGCSKKTIGCGIVELGQLSEDPVDGRIRRPGAGRKKK